MAGYDGKTCPGCDTSLPGAAASLFNARNRFPETSMVEKLWDCKLFHATLPPPEPDAHPAILAMHAIHFKLMQAMDGVVQDGLILRWVPGVLQRINALEPEWTDALVAYETIKEEHFRDDRHCAGKPNWLRERQGSKHTWWGRRENTSYHHYVVAVGADQPHNLIHSPCGTRIALAEHFLKRMQEDPEFYGMASCPACGSGFGEPFAEFEVTTLVYVSRDTCE